MSPEDGEPAPGPPGRRRPPWWPDGEPFPPTEGWTGRRWAGARGPWGGAGYGGRGPWGRSMRRGFVWRIGCAIFAVGLLAVAAGTVAILLVGGLLGLVGLSTDVRLGALVVLALGALGLVRAGRSLRRAMAPVGDLVDAAGRVEAGDLSVRVEERGPREVRQLARAFNAMSARLESDEEQRQTLLADITHELRTPLTVIQGNLEGLIDGVYPADAAHLELILDETRTLARLIDDLRTLALADRGALDLHPEPVDLLTLANETVAAVRAAADAAGVAIAVEASAPEPATVSADPTRIREVLSNLLSNALRHTPSGGRVTVRIEPGSDGWVQVAVADTGPGIAPDVQPHVFDRFVKSPDSPGTGLGLAIARDLVEAHGGSIAADSVPGSGTTIRFRLPIAGRAGDRSV